MVGASPVGSERASANSPTPVALGTSVDTDIDDQAPLCVVSPSPVPLPSLAEPSEDILLAAERMPDPD